MKVLCHLSGGLDSALAAIVTGEHPEVTEFQTLFVNYGQPYLSHEMAALDYIVPFIADRFRDKYMGNLIRRCDLALCSDGLGWPVEYIPVRNLLLTALAANIALSRGYDVVAVGNKSPKLRADDPYSFPDTSCEFYAKLGDVVSLGIGHRVPFRVEHPLLTWTGRRYERVDVLRGLVDRGVDMGKLWSCHHPTRYGDYCGTCCHCKEIQEAGYWSHFPHA